MQLFGRKIVRFTTVVAAVAAAMVAVLPPLASFHFAHERHAGGLEIVSALVSHAVSNIVARNPDLWEFEILRLETALAGYGGVPANERRLLRNANGETVVELAPADPLSWPVLAQVHSVYDNGRPVGTVEVARSLRADLLDAGLVAAVAGAVAVIVFLALRIVPLRALRRAVDRVSYLASHDPLTGLPNRALFRERMAALLAGRVEGLAVLFIDLDRFKEVNDTLGHAIGDRLLVEVAERVRLQLDQDDILARLGGDEFAVVHRCPGPALSVEALAGRIVQASARPFTIDGHTVTVGTSVGVALADAPGESVSGLLQRADLALYRAKEVGRGSFRFFEEEMNEKLRRRRALEGDLRKALANGEFTLHYQPQIDVKTSCIKGVEALIRWHHAERGNVPPDSFIALAEENGLIVELGAWVLRAACREAAGWEQPVSIAVNLSPAQVKDGELTALVARTLEETGLDPARLELEITEGVLLQDTESTLATLQALRAMGVRIAMDDFGTGYSSLGYLRRFPFDKVKIDRSFVADLDRSPDALAIVTAILSLSRSLGIRANAEGVETVNQAEVLREQGCDEVQGFLYSRPCTPEALAAMLAQPAWRPATAGPVPAKSPGRVLVYAAAAQPGVAESAASFIHDEAVDAAVAEFVHDLLAAGLAPDRHRAYPRHGQRPGHDAVPAACRARRRPVRAAV